MVTTSYPASAISLGGVWPRLQNASRRRVSFGDAALAGLLAKAGSALTSAAVRDLVRGVIAAPGGGADGAWQALVVTEPGAELAGQLEALRAEVAAGAARAAWSRPRVRWDGAPGRW